MDTKFYLLRQIGKETGYSGEALGTSYDLSNACPVCGSGAIVIGSLVVKVKEHTDLIETLNGDYLISGTLYNNLKAGNVKGIADLSKVMNQIGNDTDYYHLTSNNVFPPMLNESEGITVENQCQVCKRDGYFDTVHIGNILKGIKTKVIPCKYKYQIQDERLLCSSEIYVTWELFGNSRRNTGGKYVIHYARPRIILSRRVKDILELLEIKDLIFYPVEIEA